MSTIELESRIAKMQEWEAIAEEAKQRQTLSVIPLKKNCKNATPPSLWRVSLSFAGLPLRPTALTALPLRRFTGTCIRRSARLLNPADSPSAHEKVCYTRPSKLIADLIHSALERDR